MSSDPAQPTRVTVLPKPHGIHDELSIAAPEIAESPTTSGPGSVHSQVRGLDEEHQLDTQSIGRLLDVPALARLVHPPHILYSDPTETVKA